MTSPIPSLPPEVASSASPTSPADVRFQREWLLVDGLGGFASGTEALCPARRYHGLFFTRLPGSAKRYLLLSRFEERVLDASLEGEAKLSEALSRASEMSCTRWADGTLAPRGDQWVESFHARPWPAWNLRDPKRPHATRLTRELLMTPGRPGVLCRYENRGEDTVRLALRPFFPFREADALTFENTVLETAIQETAIQETAQAGEFVYRAYDSLPGVRVALASQGEVTVLREPTWYNGLRYDGDDARGYECIEDQFSPCVLVVELKPGAAAVIEARIDDREQASAAALDPFAAWREASSTKRIAAFDPSDFESRLRFAADDFLYREDNGRIGIVAGWPWFTEWGRDTCISLPGLTLARGDLKGGQAMLEGLAEYLHHGLLPNIFGASIEDSHYGSADASLWFSLAVRRLDRARAEAGDAELGETELHFQDALTEIAEAVFEARGEDPELLGVHADEAGLYVAGSEIHNATWMDARTSQGPVTPRAGCAVELNGLWCQLLQQLELSHAARGSKKAAKLWKQRRRNADRAFLERFWLRKENRLADVWTPTSGPDKALRPNMVMAAALEHSPLSKEQREAVVQAVDEALVTPVGLRTLSAQDAEYLGRYEGGSDERDGAYHQGTVWPWPIGFFVEASLRGKKKPSKKLVARLQALIEGFAAEFDRAGLDHVSEVFDGDEPRRPGGTIAQAWNTAELLRALQMLKARRA